MKINLLLGGRDVRSGHLNVSPFAVPGDGKVRHSVVNLDGLVEDAEATEVVALDVLDYLPAADYDDVLTHWVGKLRHGGVLSVGGLDLAEVARLLANGQMGLNVANLLIYGPQSEPWQSRKAATSLPCLAEKLRLLGLVVEKKSYLDQFYCVTARRP